MAFALVQQKGLTTRNTHVTYEIFITSHSKVMANVKFSWGQTERQKDRQRKNYMPQIYRCGRAGHIVQQEDHNDPWAGTILTLAL